MYRPVKLAFLLCISLFLFHCCISCTGSHPESRWTAAGRYSFYILDKDNREYILQTSSLDSGVLAPERDGAELNVREMDRDNIVKEGFYYHLNRKKALFSKYEVIDKVLKEVAAIPVKDFSLENFHWLGKDTLLLTGLDGHNFSQVRYLLLQTAQMKLLSAGPVDIPLPSGRFSTMSVGFVERRLNQLLIGYTYHQNFGASDYTTSDTTYVTTVSYPAMKRLHTDKDTRSAYPGGINTIQSYSFTDQQGDYYFMTCPGIALGNRPDLPTGIFRINKGSDAIDKNYFFNLSAAIHNHAYGMWSLGHQQVMVRAERKDLFTGLGDHYSKAHFEFYVADLAHHTLRKLDLPLDKGTRRECVIVKDDTAYISLNSSTEGNFIWLYNIRTGSLKKGLQLAGDTDFILRMDRL
jgi:hypothetical protein